VRVKFIPFASEWSKLKKYENNKKVSEKPKFLNVKIPYPAENKDTSEIVKNICLNLMLTEGS